RDPRRRFAPKSARVRRASVESSPGRAARSAAEGRIMRKRVERPGVREGYDRWAESYDATRNPVVALDRRVAFRALKPKAGEVVLDAGCGTGAHLRRLCAARAHPVGLDFSRGMLRVAQRNVPRALLAQADLNDPLPIREAA